MEYQQNLATFSVGVVVIVTPSLRLEVLRTVISELRNALSDVKAGELIRVRIQ